MVNASVALSSHVNGGSPRAGLPAGTYHLVVFPGAEPDDLTDAAFLQSLVAGALTLTLAPGEEARLNLRARVA